jgi:protease PrsW
MFLTALSAVVPSLLLLWYFHNRDVYPEPPRVLWTTFSLGIMSIVPTLLFAYPILYALEIHSHNQSPYLFGFAKAFATAAMPEEFFKLVVLWFYCAKHEAFDEPMDGIVYGVAVSLGFATFENVLYIENGGLSLAISRALTAVPGHAFLGAIMGYFIGQARFRPTEERRLCLLAYFVPVLLHGLYDFPLFTLALLDDTANPNMVKLLHFIVVFILVTETGLALYMMNTLRTTQLKQQAETPGLPQNQSMVEEQDKRGSSHKTHGWLFIIFGGLAATFGGILTIGLTLTLIFAAPPKQNLTSFFRMASVVGLVPLIFGVVLFSMGIGELNKGSESEENQSCQESR